jgi:hypothetical protein
MRFEPEAVSPPLRKRSKSFLVLFFKKERLFCLKRGVDASFRWHDGMGAKS